MDFSNLASKLPGGVKDELLKKVDELKVDIENKLSGGSQTASVSEASSTRDVGEAQAEGLDETEPAAGEETERVSED